MIHYMLLPRVLLLAKTNVFWLPQMICWYFPSLCIGFYRKTDFLEIHLFIEVLWGTIKTRTCHLFESSLAFVRLPWSGAFVFCFVSSHGVRPLPLAPNLCSLLYGLQFLALLPADVEMFGARTCHLACLACPLQRLGGLRNYLGETGATRKDTLQSNLSRLEADFRWLVERFSGTSDRTSCFHVFSDDFWVWMWMSEIRKRRIWHETYCEKQYNY